MLNKKYIVSSVLALSLIASVSYAQPNEEGLGQTIQITTRLHSFFGKPSWLLIIRDLDHGQTIPYLFEFTRGENFWLAFTYSRNYLITVSNLQIETYRSRFNSYKKYKINNFCHIESNGRILKGESMAITIEGDLFPYSDSYTCNVTTYTDSNFTIVNPAG